MKPNFFIVGAPKCGTSAWAQYLKSHPSVFVSDVKEPHYFATDLPGRRWTTSLADYEELFSRVRGARAVGEASVFYLYSTDAARAIRDYNPNAKIIIFLRPQEELLPSLHHQFLFSLSENIEDFETAWRLSPDRPPETVPELCTDAKLLDYQSVGRLREQVDRYLDAFPADQVRIVRFREWTRDPRAAYVQLLDFLGVEDDGKMDFPRINEAKAHLSRSLTRFILHPPKFVRVPVDWLRKVTGRKAFGLADRAVRTLATSGYRTSIPDTLRQEIREFYADDNAALEKRLAQL